MVYLSVRDGGRAIMSISITVPAYNSEKYIAATIESILNQTYTDWELIIVDDGSTDKTFEIAERYSQQDHRIKVVKQSNKGASGARNTGIRNSDPKRPYQIWLDADDTWEPDTLAFLMNILETHPEAMGVYGLARYVDRTGKQIRLGELEAYSLDRKAVEGNKLVSVTKEQPTTYNMVIFYNYIPSGGGLVRKKYIEKAGLFDEALRSCEDWDMWLRLLLYGNMIATEKVIMNYRLHESNKSGSKRKLSFSESIVRRKIIHLEDASVEKRRIAKIAWKLKYIVSVKNRIKWFIKNIRVKRYPDALAEIRHLLADIVRYYCWSLFPFPHQKIRS